MYRHITSAPRRSLRHTLDRRDWLKAAGACLLTSPALAAPLETSKTAVQNIRLGIYSGVYSAMPVAEAARRIKADGFTSVVTNFVFADARFDPLAPDWKAAAAIVDAFEGNRIRIASLFGYYNVVDPVPARRARGEARIHALIANWKRLGCRIVSTATGSFNPKSEWLESPENATEAGYLQCRSAMEKLARTAEKAGAIVAIEPYWRNVISSIERAERLFREVNSPALKLVMDPCNYFRKEDLPRMQPMLMEMFSRLGEHIVVAHAKDVKAAPEGTDLPAAGEGVLDYALYLRLLAGLGRPIYLILEHLSLAEVQRASQYMRSRM